MIERFLHSSYDEFAGRAVVLNFLPLLAEKFARQRLRALARVEGKVHDGRPVVLFLCTHNAGRSQMVFPGRRYEEWVLDDPDGKSIDDLRPVRDEIEHRVRVLLNEIPAPAPA